MTLETMTRRAADNPYLHKDFHGALSHAIEFLHRHYGAPAVRDYLRQFAAAYYAPLKADLQRRGLAALRDHYDRVFRAEGGRARMTLADDALTIEVDLNPAVAHLRARGIPVAALFRETVRTVGETLCEGTAYTADLPAYDDASGRYTQRFYRKLVPR